MPPASGNDKFTVLERRQRVAGLYLRGQSQWQIARELSIGQATVSRDIEQLRKQWRQAQSLQIDAIQERELAKIDLIEIEAWAAWEKSKANKERTTKERSSGESATNSKVVVVTEGRLPENEFLKTVQWCINKRCEILGLDAAKKIRHSGEIDAKMSDADKAAIIAGIVGKLDAVQEDKEHENDEEDAGGVAGDPGPSADLGAGGLASGADGEGDGY